MIDGSSPVTLTVPDPSIPIYRKRRPIHLPASVFTRKQLTQIVIQDVGDQIALGLTQKQACDVVGVNYNAFMSRIKKDFKARHIVDMAQANFVSGALSQIKEGKTGWQAKAWILERRYQPQFNRSPTVQLSEGTPGLCLSMDDFAVLARMGQRFAAKAVSQPQQETQNGGQENEKAAQ